MHGNQASKKLEQRASDMKPAADKPLLKSPRVEGEIPYAAKPFVAAGSPAWHGVTGTRFAFPLPATSRGPIRAREIRRAKGIQGY